MYNPTKNIFKIISRVGIIFSISCLLFISYPINISAGFVVFGGKVFYKAPSTACLNILICGPVCAPCGCGPWSDNLILPVYGVAPGWIPFLCQADAAMALGTSPMLMPGTTVIGNATSPWVFFIDGIANNIWGQFQ
ncbi:hypothetical protein K8R62_01945 [bacterium]|nr:hypothetical protein [bacterium]